MSAMSKVRDGTNAAGSTPAKLGSGSWMTVRTTGITSQPRCLIRRRAYSRAAHLGHGRGWYIQDDIAILQSRLDHPTLVRGDPILKKTGIRHELHLTWRRGG